jgi:hypothetical protein
MTMANCISRPTLVGGVLSLALALPVSSLADSLMEQAEASLSRGIDFFYSTNVNGGYVFYVTPDLSQRWGEGPAGPNTVKVQPPGTPAVGQAFLRAYKTTGNETALTAALDAAQALIRGQNRNGGWGPTINFSDLGDETVSFDDNQTQSAVSFLMALDQEVDDQNLSTAVRQAIEMMISAQLDNGGWPQKYPGRGNYHDFATFNDGGINDCIRVMIEAYQLYSGDEETENSLRKAAQFIKISQLPPPQSGWAQQYNEFLQPAWARTFEPPAVCPAVTVRNIDTLIDLYLALGDRTLLHPIPDALRWLEEVRLDNGKWARFVELGTGKALYYDRQRIRMDSMAELHPERRTGYRYETDLQVPLQAGKRRYEKALQLGRDGLRAAETPTLSDQEVASRLESLATTVKAIIASQDSSGAWITRDDRFKATLPEGVLWDGQYTVTDRISSAVFNRNVDILCEYIELSRR